MLLDTPLVSVLKQAMFVLKQTHVWDTKKLLCKKRDVKVLVKIQERIRIYNFFAKKS